MRMHIKTIALAVAGAVLATSAFGVWAVAGQDKYALEAPGGLAFSEFRDTRTGK